MDSLTFYVLALSGLNDLQKLILLTVIECYRVRAPCQPSLPTLARWCRRGRRTIMRALDGLGGHHGWLMIEWRGGRKSNVYSPGWRLLALIGRSKR